MKGQVSIVASVIFCLLSSCLFGATLNLKSEVSVSGEKVFLRDILEDASSVSENLLKEELFPSPSLGMSFVYPSGYVKQILLTKLPSLLKNNEVILPDKIKFTRLSQTLTSQEIFDLIKRDPSLEGLDIAPMSIPKMVLPVGTLKIEVKPLGPTNSKIMLVRVSFYVNDILARTIDISLKLTRKSTVYVARLHIPRGSIITDDLIEEKIVEDGSPSGISVSKDEIIGKLSTRELYPGQVITPSSVIEPPLVRKNDEVEAIRRVGSLTISVTLIALQDGYLGQTIRLRNPVSFREVMGTVTGKGKVEVF
ncbi:MAG: flagellar basal body P-ring formation chaperone FlgA [bacterium]